MPDQISGSCNIIFKVKILANDGMAEKINSRCILVVIWSKTLYFLLLYLVGYRALCLVCIHCLLFLQSLLCMHITPYVITTQHAWVKIPDVMKKVVGMHACMHTLVIRLLLKSFITNPRDCFVFRTIRSKTSCLFVYLSIRISPLIVPRP